MAEPLISPLLKATKSFRDAVRALLSLDDGQMEVLVQATRGEQGFDPSDATAGPVGQALGPAAEQLSLILSVCGFLYETARSRGLSSEAIVAELGEMAQALGIEAFEQKRAMLLRLFEPNESYDRRRQATRAASLGLPVLENAYFFCDLRGVSNAAGGGVAGFVPLVIARLEMDEPIAGQDAIVIQLTESGLADLEAKLRSARELLDSIKSELEGKLY